MKSSLVSGWAFQTRTTYRVDLHPQSRPMPFTQIIGVASPSGATTTPVGLCKRKHMSKSSWSMSRLCRPTCAFTHKFKKKREASSFLELSMKTSQILQSFHVDSPFRPCPPSEGRGHLYFFSSFMDASSHHHGASKVDATRGATLNDASQQSTLSNGGE